jgi:polyribonucleotide nucleotidyltransferase
MLTVLRTSDCYTAGTILRDRRISSVALFGVMVELTPGKTGLVHLSELGEEGQVLHEVPPQYTVSSMS